MQRFLASVCLVLLALAGLPGWGAADPPPAVIERGKAATALIVGPDDKAIGAAVCVDPAGVFVTNLLLTLDAKLELVLSPPRRPSGESQRASCMRPSIPGVRCSS